MKKYIQFASKTVGLLVAMLFASCSHFDKKIAAAATDLGSSRENAYKATLVIKKANQPAQTATAMPIYTSAQSGANAVIDKVKPILEVARKATEQEKADIQQLSAQVIAKVKNLQSIADAVKPQKMSATPTETGKDTTTANKGTDWGGLIGDALDLLLKAVKQHDDQVKSVAQAAAKDLESKRWKPWSEITD